MRKLSPAMISMLEFTKKANTPTSRTMRPSHYENIRTHEALLRRGLIVEIENPNGPPFSELTPAGLAAIS
jgi:hypothetical protein